MHTPKWEVSNFDPHDLTQYCARTSLTIGCKWIQIQEIQTVLQNKNTFKEMLQNAVKSSQFFLLLCDTLQSFCTKLM